ncbi:phage tail spike protein [Streptococcus suis]|uniref:phage tail spike protein n=1 Tax=Streptococcus suis TaxID=1307 RepID=UPI001C66B3DC|nr:phage tail spike protein [Streptococcus suis]
MIYLFDKDEKLIKIVRKSAVKTALQKYALTTERYVSDRLTVELKGLNADELEQVEYMAIQTMEDAHAFHYFYVAQKFSDSLTTLIGVQSGIEELRKSVVYDKRPKTALARDVITDLLAGTNWQARFVGETTPHSTNFYYTSIFDALKKVCEVWDLEMQFFVEMNGNRIGARYIDFKQRIGEAVGKRVVYGHNALQILQEVERTNIFTALVGRGKGEETGAGYGRKITFEDVTWSTAQGKPVNKPVGQKYLELPLMTRQYGIKNADGSMRPKIGFVDFSEEENPEVLIERTYKALIDAARPQLTLKTSSVYLKGVKVGDTIRVVRHDKKLDYDTRIFEITFNRLNNQSSDIKLGDRIGESNEAKAQTIADKAVEQFVTNEFSNFVQNLPDYLPSADGFNNNWYGAEDPTVKYPGKVLINDIWYKPDPEHEGHKIMLRWTGEVWEEILRTYESESLRDRIAEEIAQVNTSMQAQAQEHDRQVADILSKTQSVESLANQAKSDAASALARANQVKTEAIADARAQVATVNQALNTAKTELQSAIASADQKARDSQASATALRNDLNVQASKILEQARAQTALTSRVSTVETLADGTKTTVAELSKTVNKATGDITSVTARTKTVEDTLSQTRTQYEALTQTVNTQTGQIESINRKTADLQSGIDGVTERFENLRVGGTNLFKNSDFSQGEKNWHKLPEIHNEATGKYVRLPARLWTMAQFVEVEQGEDYVISLYAKKISESSSSPRLNIKFDSLHNEDTDYVEITKTDWKRFVFKFRAKKSGKELVYFLNRNGIEVDIKNIKMEKGLLATDYSPSYEDYRSEIATYKRTAEESSAELSRQIQLVDGKAVDAKTYAQQTADAIKTRLESLEIYKNAEGDRAEQYLTASREETARQLTAERTAIATNYVAKSTYDENVRGTTLKLNDIKTTADTAKQNLATYQNTVDRKLTELISTTQTLDGKINTASAKITQNANEISKRLTSTQVDKAITDKGYQTKSDVDNNITGRGYITNSALQPYALSTTVQNLVQETAGSFERQITETRGLIPTEVNQNLFDVVFSDLRATGGASFVQSDDGWIEVTIKNRWSGFHWYYSDDINPSKKQYVVSYEAYLVDTVAETARLESDFGSPDQLTLINKTPKRYTVVLNRPVNIFNYINFVCDSSETGKKFRIRNIKLEEGIVATPYIAPFPTTVLFNAVKDTVDAHKQIIGNGDSISQAIQSANKFERYISSGGDIYRVIETAKGLVAEVSGTNGLKTQVGQLKNSWAVKISGPEGLKTAINASTDGVRFKGKNLWLDGNTLIDNAVITSAMIASLDAGKITTGYLDAARIRVGAIDGSKIAFDEAFFNGLTANQAYLKKLFAQSAFITSVQAVAVSAKQIAGGIAKALNGGMDVNFDESKINFYTNVAAIRRIYTGHPTQFIKFETEGNYSRTIIGSNRNGGEVFNSATFAGIVVENTNNINTEDNVRIYGDNTLLRHAQGDVGWNINSVTQRIVPANMNAESEIWSKHFVAPDKNSKPVRLDTAVAALWDIWNHIIYNNFEFNAALRTHIKARRDNWKFELNL